MNLRTREYHRSEQRQKEIYRKIKGIGPWRISDEAIMNA